MAKHNATKGVKLHAGWVALLALALAPAGLSADIFSSIVSRCPQTVPSYDQVVAHLEKLALNPRCEVVVLGHTSTGRPLIMASVTDPAPSVHKATLFIVASQHGSEPAGACAALALLDHFAAAPTTLEQEILKYLRIVAVPVANPDGFATGHRDNAHGVDLNRDWGSLSQPETQLINQAVKLTQPDAVLDMHELPASSSKPSYQENFLETLGLCRTLPTGLCHETTSISSAIAGWMRTFGYPLNVYFDYPGDSMALCHRHFGLGQQLPTFLCEAKRGSDRSLQERAGFLILSALVIGNHIMNEGAPAAPPASPPGPLSGAERGSTGTGGMPGPQTVAAETPRVELEVDPGQNPGNQRPQLRVKVTGAPDFEYLTITVAGQMKALGNSPVSSWPLDLTGLAAGEHVVRVTAFGRGDVELVSQDIPVRLAASGVVAAR